MPTSSRTTNILLVAILAVGIGIVAMLATGARGGPLNPPGPVASTMRSLDELPAAWDRKISEAGADTCNTPRFQCVLPDATHPTGAAVLDRETGLVWERVPAISTMTWNLAIDHCVNLLTGGRSGWRTPSIDELTSLFFSATGGPFDLGGSGPVFWSTSVYWGGIAGYRYYADFAGYTNGGREDGPFRSWCVRGGSGHDPE